MAIPMTSNGNIDYTALDKINGLNGTNGVNQTPVTTNQQQWNNLDTINGIYNPNTANNGFTYGTSGSLNYANTPDGQSLKQQIESRLNNGQDITDLTQQFAGGAQTLFDSLNKKKANTNSFSAIEAYINQLKEAQRQAQLASLGKARDNSLSNLSAERGKIQPLYYGKRNETSTGSQLQAKNFAEYLAQRGQSNSGASGQAELARNVTLQGNIGRLNQDESSAFINNDRMVTDTNNAYESDVAAANANIEAQAMQNLLNAYMQQQSADREQANLDRSFNYQVGRDSVSDSNTNRQYEYQMQQFEYQKQQNAIDNEYRQKQADIDNLYQQGQLTLAQRSQALNEAQFQAQLKQQAIDNTYRQQQANISNSRASSSGTSGSYTKTQIKDATLQQFDQLLNTDHPATKDWLASNQQELIDNLGYSGYKSLVDRYQKAVEEWNKDHPTYEKRLMYSGGR